MTEVTTTAIVVVATSSFGFLSLVATLVFLWKVYKNGGRRDLTAAARALREARPGRLPVLSARRWPARPGRLAEPAGESEPPTTTPDSSRT